MSHKTGQSVPEVNNFLGEPEKKPCALLRHGEKDVCPTDDVAALAVDGRGSDS